jgi:serine/threonine-protein kinase PknK
MSAGSAIWPVVPGYEVTEVLGRGGFATVYRAHQVAVGRRQVALKVVDARDLAEETARRFRHEVTAIARMSDHDNVVSVHEVGTTTGGLPYIAMQLIEGGSFQDKIRAGALPSSVVARAGSEIADALGMAHGLDILHRDVKPDNILVGRRGQAMLADFGIATIADATRTATGTVMGTVQYTAPEVLRGVRPSPAADVFSLGATLFTLASGHSAFASDGDPLAAVMWRIVNEPAPALPAAVPSDLADLIAACLAKDPDARPTAVEVADRLAAGARSAFTAVLDVPIARSPELIDDEVTIAHNPLEATEVRPAPPDGAIGPATTAPMPTPPTPRIIALEAPDGSARWVPPPRPPRPPPPSKPLPDTRWPYFAGTTPLGVAPAAAVSDGHRVWAVDVTANAVHVLSASEDATTIEVPRAPASIAVTPTDAWVVSHHGRLTRIDAEELAVVSTIDIGHRAQSVAVTGDDEATFGVWVAGARSVVRVDPMTGEVVAEVALELHPHAVASAGPDLWVLHPSGDAVTRIDPTSNRVVDTVRVPGEPLAIAATRTAIWVACRRSRTVSRIDPTGDNAVRQVEAQGSPIAIAADERAVWYLDSTTRALRRIDPKTNKRTARVDLDPGGRALALTTAAVWVTRPINWKLQPSSGAITCIGLDRRVHEPVLHETASAHSDRGAPSGDGTMPGDSSIGRLRLPWVVAAVLLAVIIVALAARLAAG